MRLGSGRRDGRQGAFLHGEIGFDILMDGIQGLVAQPESDHFGSHSLFQHAHGGPVAKQMWRDRPPLKTGKLGCGPANQFLDLLKGAETSQPFPVAVGQQKHGGGKLILSNPLAQLALGLAPERQRAAFAAFALEFDLLGLGARQILHP